MEKVKELKAIAYDLIAQLEYNKARLNEINAEIARLVKVEIDRSKIVEQSKE